MHDFMIERVIPGALLILRAEEVAVGSLVEEDALVQQVLRHRRVLRNHRHVQHVLAWNKSENSLNILISMFVLRN